VNTELQQFIRDMGALFASTGGSAISGRILGWLIVCDPPEQSLVEIQAAVGASKASVSTMTRMLVESGFIERAAGNDARRIAFRVHEDVWSIMMERRFGMLAQLIETGERGRQALRGTPVRRRRQLDAMIEFCGFMHEELSGISQRWRRRNVGGKRKASKRS
jgi:DNA-binding transcriptional regulator GbsR (MarR family)